MVTAKDVHGDTPREDVLKANGLQEKIEKHNQRFMDFLLALSKGEVTKADWPNALRDTD